MGTRPSINARLAQALGQGRTLSRSSATIEERLAQALGQREGRPSIDERLRTALEGGEAQEQPGIISGESTFLKILDTLNLPQQMLFGGLTQREGEPLTEAMLRGARQNFSFHDVREATGGFERFGTNIDPRNFAASDPGIFDILGEAALATAADLLLDPLNVVPFSKIGKGVQSGGRALRSTAPVARTLQTLEQAAVTQRVIKPVAQLLSKTAFRSPEERRVIEIIDTVAARIRNQEPAIFERAAANKKLIEDVAKETGYTAEEVSRFIVANVEAKTPPPTPLIPEPARPLRAKPTPRQGELPIPRENVEELQRSFSDVLRATDDILEQTPPRIRKEALKFKEQIEDQFARELRSGLPVKELEDSRLDYILHLMTPAAKKAAEKQGRFIASGFRTFSPAHASQIARELRGLSVSEINRLASEGRLPGFEGEIISRFLVDDPAALLAVRELRGAKAAADFEVLSRAVTEVGVPTNFAPAHYRELVIVGSQDPKLAAIGERFRGFSFAPEVAHHLNEVATSTFNPEATRKFLQHFDRVQGIWKSITLAIFPSYHLRNVVGNAWNNYLAGLTDPRWYMKAADLQGGRSEAFTIGGKEFTRRELASLAEDVGVVNRGFLAVELPEDLRIVGKIGRTTAAERIPLVGRAVRFGFRKGTELENNARLAHWLWRLDAGDTLPQAALSVKRYLFDYATGLTAFEKGVMRRIFPFYSWSRMNIPLQLTALVENPRPFIRLAQFVRTARSDEPELQLDDFQRDILPTFIQKQSGIPIRFDNDGNPEYFLLGGWLPAADLETLGRPTGPLDKALSLLTPFAKIPIEQAFNYDSFLNRKIEEFPGESQKLLGLDVRRRLVHASKIIRLFGEVDALMRGAMNKELTEDELTALSKVSRALFGLKGYSVNISSQLRRQRFERQEMLQKRRSLLRRGDEANAETIDEILFPEDEP